MNRLKTLSGSQLRKHCFTAATTSTTTTTARHSCGQLFSNPGLIIMSKRMIGDYSRFPEDVGILAMEVYFPSTYVSQTDLGMCLLLFVVRVSQRY